MAAAPFAHEREATSLQDLEIVRRIVEREGCLEALAQLLATHARAAHTERSMAATASLAAAPMVVQSLLEQLRSVSVQIVESIERWRLAHSDHQVFQWRGLNYLAKMLRDLDFLALHAASIARLQAFRGLRLQRNPFLSPLHLDHAALKDSTPDAACRLGLFVGNVDMRRIFAASQVLRKEEAALGLTHEGVASDEQEQEPVASTTARLHWSHTPVKLALSASAPSLQQHEAADPRDAMAFDVELAKELVFQHEHELGAMKEELAVLQRRLQRDLVMAPDQRRQLQTRAAGLSHDIKLRTGDLFHRRNELQRKEAVLRMDRRRTTRARQVVRALRQQQQQKQPDAAASPRDDDEPIHFSASESFRAALQADELRRQDLVDKFATFAKLQAAASATKRRLQSLSSPHHSPLGSSSRPRAARVMEPPPLPPLDAMTSSEVEVFVAGLAMGEDAARYGSQLRARGIDGKLLAQADEHDLEQLGVGIRLHRIKILEAVRQAQSVQT